MESATMFNGYPVNSMINVAQNPVKGWRLPGQGTAYTTCGKTQDVGCLNMGSHVLMATDHKMGIAKRISMRCKRPSCPVCSRNWLVEATKEAERRVKNGKPRHQRRAIHCTISPPPELYHLDTDKDFHKLRRMANKWLKIAGLKGYMLVYHPFRQNKEKKYKNTPDFMKWRYSPHFHAIGYGWIKWGKEQYERSKPYRTNNTEKNNKRNMGWIVKNHRVRKSIGATIYYQLSHAGIKETRKTISWGGILSWISYKLPKKPKVRLDCPLCGNRFRPVKYVGRGSSPLEGSPEDELVSIDTNDYKYADFPTSRLMKRGNNSR